MEDHLAITTKLNSLNIEHFTYSPRQYKPAKVLIKGVATDFEMEEIHAELQRLNLPFISASFLTRTQDSQRIRLPLVLVNVPRTSLASYYELDLFFGLAVRVKMYKSNKLPQRFNCQQYGHSSYCCARKTICVRCGENHRVVDCTSEVRKCAHCLEEHTANYRGCPKFKQAANSYKKQQAAHKISPPKLTKSIDTNNLEQFPRLPQAKKTSNQNSNAAATPAIPSRNAWGIPSTIPNISNTSNTFSTSNTSSLNSMGDIFRELSAIFNSFNIPHIVSIIRQNVLKLGSATGLMDKLYIIIDTVTQLFN